MISDEVLKVIKENEGIPVYAYVDVEALRLANEEVNKLDFKKVILLNIDTI